MKCSIFDFRFSIWLVLLVSTWGLFAQVRPAHPANQAEANAGQNRQDWITPATLAGWLGGSSGGAGGGNGINTNTVTAFGFGSAIVDQFYTNYTPTAYGNSQNGVYITNVAGMWIMTNESPPTLYYTNDSLISCSWHKAVGGATPTGCVQFGYSAIASTLGFGLFPTLINGTNQDATFISSDGTIPAATALGHIVAEDPFQGTNDLNPASLTLNNYLTIASAYSSTPTFSISMFGNAIFTDYDNGAGYSDLKLSLPNNQTAFESGTQPGSSFLTFNANTPNAGNIPVVQWQINGGSTNLTVNDMNNNHILSEGFASGLVTLSLSMPSASERGGGAINFNVVEVSLVPTNQCDTYIRDMMFGAAFVHAHTTLNNELGPDVTGGYTELLGAQSGLSAFKVEEATSGAGFRILAGDYSARRTAIIGTNSSVNINDLADETEITEFTNHTFVITGAGGGQEFVEPADVNDTNHLATLFTVLQYSGGGLGNPNGVTNHATYLVTLTNFSGNIASGSVLSFGGPTRYEFSDNGTSQFNFTYGGAGVYNATDAGSSHFQSSWSDPFTGTAFITDFGNGAGASQLKLADPFLGNTHIDINDSGWINVASLSNNISGTTTMAGLTVSSTGNSPITVKSPNGTTLYLHFSNPSAGISTITANTTQ